MNGVAVQSEAHEYGLASQLFLEKGHYGDASSRSLRDGGYAKGLGISLVGSHVADVVDGRDIGMASVVRGHLHAHAFGCDALKMGCEECRDLVRVLVGDQAHGYLGVGLARDDRLGPFTRISAPDPVHVERGPDRVSLVGRVSLLAKYILDVKCLFILLQGEGSLCHFCPLFSAQLDHLIIESRDRDVVVLVVQGGDHLCQDIDRVCHCASVQTGVQIPVRTGHFHFHIAQSAQPGRDGRLPVADHPGVGDQDHVVAEFLLISLHEPFQAARAHFFFPFDHELHIAGKTRLADHDLKGLDVHEHLAFVVRRPPREYRSFRMNLCFLDHRLKRGRGPQIEGIRWLDIIVAVDQNGRKAFVDDVLPVDDGIARCLADLNLVTSCRLEVITNRFSRLQYVSFELGVRRDRRDFQQFDKLLDEAILILIYIAFYACH